jgi:hypothetical protein
MSRNFDSEIEKPCKNRPLRNRQEIANKNQLGDLKKDREILVLLTTADSFRACSFSASTVSATSASSYRISRNGRVSSGESSQRFFCSASTDASGRGLN